MNRNAVQYWLNNRRQRIELAQQIQSERLLLSKIAGSETVWSMSRMGNWAGKRDEELAGEVPMFDGKEKTGAIEVPEELKKFRHGCSYMYVWGEANQQKDAAFKIEATGEWDATRIQFDYGARYSGVVDLRLTGMHYTIPCDVPKGFTLDMLLALLKGEGIDNKDKRKDEPDRFKTVQEFVIWRGKFPNRAIKDKVISEGL